MKSTVKNILYIEYFGKFFDKLDETIIFCRLRLGAFGRETPSDPVKLAKRLLV